MRLRKTMLTIQFKKENGQVMKPPMNAKTVMSHFALSPVSDFIILIRSMYLDWFIPHQVKCKNG
jgi:hypothetical protein